MTKIFHGGGLDKAIETHGGKRKDWLDLSTGINPNSYPVPQISDEAWSALPDTKAEDELLSVARKYYNLHEEASIVAGNGTQALMQVLPHVLDVKHVAVVMPSYEEHSHIWKSAGATVTHINKVVDCPDNADLLIVINPNNPDGRSWQPVDLVLVAQKVKHLIVDEAFCDAYPENSLASMLPENTILLRSFGKFFGLAGVRLGFIIANQKIVEAVRDCIGPWAVSGSALEIGCQALGDQEWIAETCGHLEDSSLALARLLDAAGLEVMGRNRLFVFVQHTMAPKLFEHLCEQKILVRPFETMRDKLRFGLCQNDKELKRFEKALKSFG